MPDSGENRSKANTPAPAPEQEHLPCPRCDSTNTKFCYYNNYNFSQPRHFCKSCRRYWTHGGTLRDIPVRGGNRKNAKRSRTHHYITSSSQDFYHHHHPLPATPVVLPLASGQFGAGDLKTGTGLSGSFTSLLNIQGNGLLGMGGFGLELGGIEDMGFGLGRGVWLGDGCFAAASGGGAHGGGVVGNTWQMESADCFGWPELGISTPGNAFQ